MTARSVVIVGKAITDEELELFSVPGRRDWERWGLNDPPPDGVVGFTRWFQLHSPAYMAKHYPFGLESMDYWRHKRGVRLYMDRYYSEYPDSEAYPKEAVEALTPRGWYHASSFDWMLALAIAEGFRTIRMVGVELNGFPCLNGEPISARPCLEYWCGVADGRGISLEIQDIRTSDLFTIIHVARLKSELQYGFDREPGLDLEVGEHGRDDPWEDVR